MRGAAAIQQFLDFKQHNRGRARRTLQIYRHALDHLVGFLGKKDLLSATTDDLLAFTGPWLAKRNIIAAGRRPYIAAVRQLYGWLHSQRVLDVDPSIGVPYPKSPKNLPRAISLADSEKLMWAPDFNTFDGIRDGAIIMLLTGCGMRVSGLVALNESDVMPQVVDGKKRLFLRLTEKGDKVRLVPVPAEADLQLRVYMEHPQLKEIDRQLENGDRVLFISVRNRRIHPKDHRGEARRLTRAAVLLMIKKYGRAQGLPEKYLHPHSIRHLYGTELAEGDVHVLVQQQLLGHEDPKSTAIYTHLATRKLFKEVDRANPLSKMNTPTSEILQRFKKS